MNLNASRALIADDKSYVMVRFEPSNVNPQARSASILRGPSVLSRRASPLHNGEVSITSSSAAVAGATALRDGQSYTKAADDVSSFNGFTNSQNNMTVTVSEPTLPAPYPSDVTYVEVDIAQNVPTYFLRVLGYNSMKVAARAVSGAVAGPACIYVGTGTFSNLGHTQAFEAVNVIRRRCANFHLGPEGTKDDAPGSKGAATVSAPGLG